MAGSGGGGGEQGCSRTRGRERLTLRGPGCEVKIQKNKLKIVMRGLKMEQAPEWPASRVEGLVGFGDANWGLFDLLPPREYGEGKGSYD